MSEILETPFILLTLDLLYLGWRGIPSYESRANSMKGVYVCFLSKTPPLVKPIMTSSWTPETLAAYRLVRCLEIGNATLLRIFNAYTNRVVDFLKNKKAWQDIGLSEHQQQALQRSLDMDIENELACMEAQRIRFYISTDETFPQTLRTIPDPPAALFMRGGGLREGLRLAIVGTRKMTSYGKRTTTYFSETISEHHITIVSGLAFGVDATAHRGALDVNHPTIAVLPCGIDDRSIMPQSHVPLAKEILEKGGTLISEHAPGTPALPYLYLHRNRIISGLAEATLVVEADVKSGALTTAKLALEQGREVLAIPGPIWSDVSKGTNQLIKDGATPCLSTEDILASIGIRQPQQASLIAETRNHLPMNAAERTVLDAITEPLSADDLVRKLRLPPAEINALLSILEMKGYVSMIERGVYEKR